MLFHDRAIFFNSHKNVFICVRTKYATRHNHTHTHRDTHTYTHTDTLIRIHTQRETERNDSTLFGKLLLCLDLFHTAFLRSLPSFNSSHPLYPSPSLSSFNLPFFLFILPLSPFLPSLLLSCLIPSSFIT